MGDKQATGQGEEMNSPACPFCSLPQERIVDSNSSGVVIRDGFPVSHGHTLIVSHRHVGSFFELTVDERGDLMILLENAKKVIDFELQPAGYNIGINDGVSAGRTVPHLHIHLIPRYLGDCADPRGGVRWVLPSHADYWSKK